MTEVDRQSRKKYAPSEPNYSRPKGGKAATSRKRRRQVRGGLRTLTGTWDDPTDISGIVTCTRRGYRDDHTWPSTCRVERTDTRDDQERAQPEEMDDIMGWVPEPFWVSVSTLQRYGYAHDGQRRVRPPRAERRAKARALRDKQVAEGVEAAIQAAYCAFEEVFAKASRAMAIKADRERKVRDRRKWITVRG